MEVTKPTAAMQVCAAEVRECPCAECLHYAECRKKGFPASRLGRYLAYLNIYLLPNMKKRLSPLFKRGLDLRATAPCLYEDEDGQFAVIRCYTGKTHAVICRVYLDGDETEEQAKTKIFNEVVRTIRKNKHGKQTMA